MNERRLAKGSWNFYIHKDMYKEQKLWLYTDWSYFDSWETCDIVKGSWGFYTSILFRDVDRHNPQLCSNDACPPLYRHLEGILFKILFKIYQDLYLFRTLYTHTKRQKMAFEFNLPLLCKLYLPFSIWCLASPFRSHVTRYSLHRFKLK